MSVDDLSEASKYGKTGLELLIAVTKDPIFLQQLQKKFGDDWIHNPLYRPLIDARGYSSTMPINAGGAVIDVPANVYAN